MRETGATMADIREIVLSNNTFGPAEIAAIAQTINEDYSQFIVLRDATAELETREDRPPAATVRLGVCYYLQGRFARCVQTLTNADGGALALFFLGRASFQQGDFRTAIERYNEAKAAGYSSDDCAVAIAEATRHAGDSPTALTMLDQLFGPVEQTAEYLYQRGATVASIGGNPREVIALMERAVESDPRHAGALFGLAMQNDRYGNDAEAMGLYQRAASCFPAHVGSLLNLGLLFEDRQEYDRAQQCYRRILDVYPAHPQASLFLKDANDSTDMYQDEDQRREGERMRQVLNIPVTDFELSVRSRNCLKTLGIRTLGDLTRTTEQDLLQSKNFGETSLIEIRDMLGSKSLSLGMFANERAEPEPVLDTATMSPDERQLLERPIADLNLSVRARKCMVRLGLTKIGELIRKTGDDLLECKNFGVTSLNEVRDRLKQVGLKLRGD